MILPKYLLALLLIVGLGGLPHLPQISLELIPGLFVTLNEFLGLGGLMNGPVQF
jgi:hypothetical protein